MIVARYVCDVARSGNPKGIARARRAALRRIPTAILEIICQP
jgi:hypothetical protein